jgi:hypothetical protein
LARRNSIQQEASTVLSFDFSDLAMIVNGVSGDPIQDQPFDCHFTKAKIVGSWEKIGFVPFTRNCLQNSKVRRELGQHMCNKTLKDLQVRYDTMVENVEAALHVK